jgi:hypothetical protein
VVFLGRRPPPARDEHRHPLGVQAPDGEGERLERPAVEPGRVVDHDQERLLIRDLGQQGEGRQPDEKAVGCRLLLHPERAAERRGLAARQPIDVAQHRSQQLMQPGEGELRFGLDARGQEHTRAGGPGAGDGRMQQGALAEPGFAKHQQRRARRPASKQQRTDLRQLGVTTDQPGLLRARQHRVQLGHPGPSPRC